MIAREDPPARLGPPATPTPSTRRDPEIDLNAAVEPYVGAAIVGLASAVLVLLVLTLNQARRIGRLRRRLDGLTRGADGRSLDEVLDAHLDRVFKVAAELDELSARSAVHEAVGRRSIQRVGLVRFNPFEDTGGNQSFALALLDGAGNGIVVSSLHSRTGTRIYAKAIADGRSEGALSTEESAALQQALSAPAPGTGRGSGSARGSAAGPA